MTRVTHGVRLYKNSGTWGLSVHAQRLYICIWPYFQTSSLKSSKDLEVNNATVISQGK